MHDVEDEEPNFVIKGRIGLVLHVDFFPNAPEDCGAPHRVTIQITSWEPTDIDLIVATIPDSISLAYVLSELPIILRIDPVGDTVPIAGCYEESEGVIIGSLSQIEAIIEQHDQVH